MRIDFTEWSMIVDNISYREFFYFHCQLFIAPYLYDSKHNLLTALRENEAEYSWIYKTKCDNIMVA